MGKYYKTSILLGAVIMILVLSACSKKPVIPSQQTGLTQETDPSQDVKPTLPVTSAPEITSASEATPTPDAALTAEPTPAQPEPTEIPKPEDMAVDELFYAYPEMFPVIDSSTARKPITAAIHEYFMGKDNAEKIPLCSKTHGAWLNLADGVADIVFLVAPTEEEESHFREKKVNIEMKPYGYDGLGFIVSPECPVKSLSSEQIRGIYECRINNWSEVGGPDAEIHPYFRNDQSGSQRLFESFLWPDGNVPDFASMLDHFYFADDMSTITEEVAYDPYAIGYNIISYLDLEYSDYITAIEVDGAYPSTENFRNRSYPFITTACVAIRADEEPASPARKLFDWIGSEKSIALIKDNSSLHVAVGESEILRYDENDPSIQQRPLSERLNELPDSLRNVFAEGGEFAYIETLYEIGSLHDQEYYTIKSFQPYITDGADSQASAGEYTAAAQKYTIIDMDGDGKNEIICLIACDKHSLADYLLLSDVDGKACGYLIVYRGLNPLYADGRAWGSSGAAYNDLYRITGFTTTGYNEQILATERDGYYEIDGKETDADTFYAYCRELNSKDPAVWAQMEE